MHKPPEPDRHAPVRGTAAFGRLALIAVILAGIVAGFAWFAGALGPRGLSARGLVDTVQGPDPHVGFRRNHAKGLCVSGRFDGNGAGAAISDTAFFARQRASVIGRFATASNNPYVPDASVPVHSLALQLRLPDGQQWRTGMNDIPGFPVATPAAFEEQQLATRPDPATGKPDPKALAAFGQRHPEAVAFVQALKASPRASGFANDTYNSINAFVFVAADGSRHAARWSLQPEQAFVAAAPAAGPDADRDVWFERLLAEIGGAPQRWHLIVTLAGPDDAVDDASQIWPADRTQIDVGTLTLDHAASEEQGGCRDIVYDPLVLPHGIEPSGDPLLSARSAAYAVSYRRRAGEPPGKSALAGRSAGVAP